jgi:hypothetical protein
VFVLGVWIVKFKTWGQAYTFITFASESTVLHGVCSRCAPIVAYSNNKRLYGKNLPAGRTAKSTGHSILHPNRRFPYITTSGHSNFSPNQYSRKFGVGKIGAGRLRRPRDREACEKEKNAKTIQNQPAIMCSLLDNGVCPFMLKLRQSGVQWRGESS